MSDRFEQETLRLGLLLRSLAKTRERSIRSLEQKMGVSDGIFYKVLNGKITMQMRHLLMIVDALGMTPAEFFEVAYPKTTLPASTSQKDLQEAREEENADLEGKVRRVLLQIIGLAETRSPALRTHPTSSGSNRSWGSACSRPRNDRTPWAIPTVATWYLQTSLKNRRARTASR